MRAVHSLSAAALVLGALGAACGDSSGPNLSFPNLSATLRNAFCVMDNVTVNESRSGTISTSDCDSSDIDPADSSYFEVYVVKVASQQAVTFDISSNFDSYLTLLRLDSYTTTSAQLTFLDDNDDRSSVDLDALLTYTLLPNVDYVIVVSGFDYSETGSYTLDIN
jgi:hypothetical protein